MGEGIVHMCGFVHMCTNSLHNCSKESKILICTVEQTYTYAYCRMKVISFCLCAHCGVCYCSGRRRPGLLMSSI